jgi:hypothetical protein
MIGAGVAGEITYALLQEMPVYYIHNHTLNRIKAITIKPIEGSDTNRIYATFDYEI